VSRGRVVDRALRTIGGLTHARQRSSPAPARDRRHGAWPTARRHIRSTHRHRSQNPTLFEHHYPEGTTTTMATMNAQEKLIHDLYRKIAESAVLHAIKLGAASHDEIAALLQVHVDRPAMDLLLAGMVDRNLLRMTKTDAGWHLSPAPGA